MESEPEAAVTDLDPTVETVADAPDSRSSLAKSRRQDILYSVVTGLAYIGFQQMLSSLRVTNPLLLTGLSLVSLLISLVFTVRMARALCSPLSQWLCLAFSAVIMLPFVLLPIIPMHSKAQALSAVRVYTAYLDVFRAIPALRGLLLICLAVSFGVVISRLVREIKILLPVAVVLAMVDLYVVFGGGLVTQANTGKAPVASMAMSALTVPLTPKMPKGVPAPPPLAVGFADFMFIALFFACFARFQLPARKTFLILCGVLCAYLVTVVVGKIDLPALVPIAAVVIGVNLRAFRYERSEAFALLYAGLIVLAVLGFSIYWSHR